MFKYWTLFAPASAQGLFIYSAKPLLNPKGVTITEVIGKLAAITAAHTLPRTLTVDPHLLYFFKLNIQLPDRNFFL